MEEIVFPNQIRHLRRLGQRSMQDLADHLGMSLSAVSKIEKGYRRIDQEQLVSIAGFLGCRLEDVFVDPSSSPREIVEAWARERDRREQANESGGLRILGAGLRRLRQDAGLTLAELARRAGLTLSVYHRVEMGQRALNRREMKAVAQGLGLSSKQLAKAVEDLHGTGALTPIMRQTQARLTAPGLGRQSTVTAQRAATTTDEMLIPVYGRPDTDGAIRIDRNRPLTMLPAPAAIRSSAQTYGVTLCTGRLGTLLPAHAILLAEPSPVISLGDLVLFYEDAERARVLSVRGETEAGLTGWQWNPDEQVALPSAPDDRVHRVVGISLP